MQNILTVVISSIITFPIAFLMFALINKKFSDEKQKSNLAFISSFSLFSLIAIVSFFIIDHKDFAYRINFIEVASMLFCGFAIYTFAKIEKLQRFMQIIIFLSSVLATYFIPDIYLEATFPINLYITKTLFVLGIFTIVNIFKYINTIDAVAVSQSGAIGFGIVLLFLSGALPALFGFYGGIILSIFTALLVFATYPAKIKTNNAFFTGFSFIFAWLLTKCGQEISIASSVVVIGFLIMEVFFATAKKLTFFEKYKDIEKNTFHYEASILGLHPNIIKNLVIKILMISIFLSACQLFSPNDFSVLIFSSIVISWLLFQMKVDKKDFELKSINKNFIKDMKENISEIKNFINRK